VSFDFCDRDLSEIQLALGNGTDSSQKGLHMMAYGNQIRSTLVEIQGLWIVGYVGCDSSTAVWCERSAGIVLEFLDNSLSRVISLRCTGSLSAMVIDVQLEVTKFSDELW